MNKPLTDLLKLANGNLTTENNLIQWFNDNMQILSYQVHIDEPRRYHLKDDLKSYVEYMKSAALCKVGQSLNIPSFWDGDTFNHSDIHTFTVFVLANHTERKEINQNIDKTNKL